MLITITINTDDLTHDRDIPIQASREVARILDAMAQDIHADCDDGRSLVDVAEAHGGLVDWSKVCQRPDCQRFPNRCDHVPLRGIRVLDGAGALVGTLQVRV